MLIVFLTHFFLLFALYYTIEKQEQNWKLKYIHILFFLNSNTIYFPKKISFNNNNVTKLIWNQNPVQKLLKNWKRFNIFLYPQLKVLISNLKKYDCKYVARYF